MFDLKIYMNHQRIRVNECLTQLVQQAPAPTRLTDAMGYALMAGGKRVRPILCLAAAEAVGPPEDSILQAACALEMIHTYSLIHDDLPAMDNDALRRGKPTCHVAYDEATAILAGDALLTLAFEVLSKAALDGGGGTKWLRAIGKAAGAAGRSGMIEGQMQDMAAEGKALDREALERMHALKTGALIEASVEIGATLADADQECIASLRRYARGIGLAFQVADDILNVQGDADKMGKATGTDRLRGKGTYPALMGLPRSMAFGAQLIADALHAIENFDNKSDPLRAIARYIVERER
jgi:geranylgeranyl diphosphate synthase, type II